MCVCVYSRVYRLRSKARGRQPDISHEMRTRTRVRVRNTSAHASTCTATTRVPGCPRAVRRERYSPRPRLVPSESRERRRDRDRSGDILYGTYRHAHVYTTADREFIFYGELVGALGESLHLGDHEADTTNTYTATVL